MSKVLVVEDSPDCLQPLKRLLQLAGHEVECARDGVEALTLMKSFRPDTLVTDLMMPGMDGLELIETIRHSGGCFADLPIVVYTAASSGRSNGRLKELGVAAIHSKSEVDVNLLLRSIQGKGNADQPLNHGRHI